MEGADKSLPSTHEVLNCFADLVQHPPNPVYVEYDELLDAWNNVRSAPDFSMQSLLQFVAKYSINTKSPYFLSKLYGGADNLSLFADMLISYYNTNVHVYSTSPVFTLAENLMIQRVSQLLSPDVGFGSGLFLPGGSYCNTVGIIAARYAHDARTKTNGNCSTPLSIIASHRCHYSVDKAAIMLGIGLDNVIKIDYDAISHDELEEIIVKRNVFCIVSTFGTTSEGVLESVTPWHDLLQRYRVWHHVDAAIGGVLLYSPSCASLTSHLREADSITIDFHKIANISVQCSVLMVHDKHKNILYEVTNVASDYLFHSADHHDGEVVQDIAAMSFQCGRRGDAFRLFVIDNLSDMSHRIDDFLQRVRQFKCVVQDDHRFCIRTTIGHETVTHVLFTPALLLDDTKEYDVSKVISEIVKKLRTENIFIEYHTTYFRIIPVNPQFREEQMKHLLERIYFWLTDITL